MKDLRPCRALLAALLCLCLLPTAFAGEYTPVAWVGRADRSLKVRTEPDRAARGLDTIAAGATVYVLEKTDEEWLLVVTEKATGYVLARYVSGMHDVGGVDLSLLKELPEIPNGEDPFVKQAEPFEENYTACVLRADHIYQTPSLTGRRVWYVEAYEPLVVSAVSGDWSLVRYKDQQGYMLSTSLYKWERLDPYAGEIPGLPVLPRVVFLASTAEVYSLEDNSILKADPLPPGSCIAAFERDLLGRYRTPYNRTTGYVDGSRVACELAVVPWQEAQPGDLIAAMTTYYAVGVHTEKHRGRNWNIYLSTAMLSGTVLQPGQAFDMNRAIGPYQRSTGYHEAPILGSNASSGYGGGTCQVSTTFYVASIQLPILITHRRVHSDHDVGINYVPRGFDAAVGSGGINLQLVNTLPYAIRYQFFVSDGVMTCCIFRQ